MKKLAIILACMLACFILFTGCTKQKDGDDQDTNLGNSVENDDAGLDIDTEKNRVPRMVPTVQIGRQGVCGRTLCLPLVGASPNPY